MLIALAESLEMAARYLLGHRHQTPRMEARNSPVAEA